MGDDISRSPSYDRLDVSAEDTEAVMRSRRELGTDYEPALADSFVDRVDKIIDARVQERVDAALAQRPKQADSGKNSPLPYVSLVFGIPLTAIGATLGDGVAGIAIVWTALLVINIVDAQRRRR